MFPLYKLLTIHSSIWKRKLKPQRATHIKSLEFLILKHHYFGNGQGLRRTGIFTHPGGSVNGQPFWKTGCQFLEKQKNIPTQ